MKNGQLTMNNGTINNGRRLWTVDCGLSTIDNGQWTIDCGLLTTLAYVSISLYHRSHNDQEL